MWSDKVIEVIQAQGSARRGDKVLHHAWTWRNRRRNSAGSTLWCVEAHRFSFSKAKSHMHSHFESFWFHVINSHHESQCISISMHFFDFWSSWAVGSNWNSIRSLGQAFATLLRARLFAISVMWALRWWHLDSAPLVMSDLGNAQYVRTALSVSQCPVAGTARSLC